MATSPTSPTWKLKESVRFMRINATNKGDSAQPQSLGPRLTRSFGRRKDPPVKEIKVRS